MHVGIRNHGEVHVTKMVSFLLRSMQIVYNILQTNNYCQSLTNYLKPLKFSKSGSIIQLSDVIVSSETVDWLYDEW